MISTMENANNWGCFIILNTMVREWIALAAVTDKP